MLNNDFFLKNTDLNGIHRGTPGNEGALEERTNKKGVTSVKDWYIEIRAHHHESILFGSVNNGWDIIISALQMLLPLQAEHVQEQTVSDFHEHLLELWTKSRCHVKVNMHQNLLLHIQHSVQL
jgi:hypothetical protein